MDRLTRRVTPGLIVFLTTMILIEQNQLVKLTPNKRCSPADGVLQSHELCTKILHYSDRIQVVKSDGKSRQ